MEKSPFKPREARPPAPTSSLDELYRGLLLKTLGSKFLWHVPSVNGNLRGFSESFPTALDVPLVEREVKRLLLPDVNTLIRADTGRQADCDPS